MSNDGGLTAKLEEWIVTVLTALEYGGSAVFKEVDHWRHQVGATGAGLEAFQRYAPFAFVGYQQSDSAREGGHELREIPTIYILIGTYNNVPGVARIGDASHLGTSKIRDLVIAALESQTPTGDLGCDECYYADDIVVVDAEKRHAIEMAFDISKMTPKAEEEEEE